VHETVSGRAVVRAMKIARRLSSHTPETVAYNKRLVRNIITEHRDWFAHEETLGKRFDWLRASIRSNASLVVLLWMVHQPMLAQSQQQVTPSNGVGGRN